MSDTQTALQPAFPGATRPGRITKAAENRFKPQLKAGLDAMVWGIDDSGPLEYDDAARSVNMTVRAMRKALERPDVQRYLREQRQVMRAAACASNISHAVQIRNSSKNAMARLGAIRLLEAMDEDGPTGGRQSSPGLVIQIVTQGQADIRAFPAESQERDREITTTYREMSPDE